jgi:type I restriction enzyme S subunit
MKRYAKYKDSGVEWIGVIPEGWATINLKYVGKLYGGLTGKSGIDFNNDENSNNKPYIPYTNIYNNTYISKNHFQFVSIKDGEIQNLVKKNDLFFLMSSETYQDLGKSCILIDDIEELYLNSFCKGFRVFFNNLNPIFLNYQLSSPVFKEIISIKGNGFTRINLRQDRLLETICFIPPLKEQEQIVAFLDEKTSHIDNLLDVSKRKIGLLKEQRTSIINQVVSKGLNPNTKMKDSGVEWIGEIPDGWVIVSIKHLVSTKITDGPHETPTWMDEGIPFLSAESVQDNKLDFNKKRGFISLEIHQEYSKKCKPKRNDILIVKSGSTTGKSTIVETDEEFNIWSPMCILRANLNKVTPKFLFKAIQSFYFRRFIELGWSFGTQPNIGMGVIENIKIIIPPLEEQEQIVAFLDEKTSIIDKSISIEERRIGLLKEYRQSLISEVITGKIKVSADE